MKSEKIKNLVEMQTGLVLSRKGAKQLELIKQGVAEQISLLEPIEYKVFSLRTLNKYGEINQDEIDTFQSSEELSDKYLTQKNDILVRLFAPVVAALIDEKYENFVIPSQFAVLRIKSDKVLPGFLHLCLNEREAQNQLNKYEDASWQLRSIKTKSIGEVTIPILSMEKQQKIVEIKDLAYKKEFLMKKLVEQEKIYNEAIIRDLIKN